MTIRTVPFDFGLFYHAMIALLGREPDRKTLFGLDGWYSIRYDPRDEGEERKFATNIAILKRWLGIFELIPIRTLCEFGHLPHPQEDEKGKEYLLIFIAHPVEKVKESR